MALVAGSPRYEVLNYIDGIAFNIDDDATPAVLLFMFSDGEEDLEELFDAYDVLFLVESWVKRIPNRRDLSVPVHYSWVIPVTIISKDKTGITGTEMQFKANLGMMAVIEASARPGAAGYTLESTGAKPHNQRVGGVMIYKTTYTIVLTS